jgi:hypothetical protein
MTSQLTFPMIFRELQREAYIMNITNKKYMFNDPELKAKTDYDINSDILSI